MLIELREAQGELAALWHLPLAVWAEQVHTTWPASDHGSESDWVCFVTACVACRLAAQSDDPAAAVAAVRHLTDAHRRLKGTIYADRAGDIWSVVMEVEEADDAAVLIVASEEIADAARRLVQREPMYRVVLRVLTASVDEKVEHAQERVRRAERQAEGVLAQLQITVLPSVHHVESRIVESPYLTADEAAVYLRTTLQGVYSLRKRNLLHPLPGRTGRLLFTRENLDRCLETRRRGR